MRPADDCLSSFKLAPTRRAASVMKESSFTIKIVDGRAWASFSSARAPGDARIPQVLRWMVEQLHLGNFETRVDDKGQLLDLLLGAAASPPIDDADLDSVADSVKTRALAVNIAGLLAAAREEGVEPAHEQLAKMARE